MRLIVAFTLLLSASAHAQVRASIDRDRISLSETVTLEVTTPSGAAQLGPPAGTDFSVVGHSTFTQMNIVGGRRTQSTTTSLTLRPTRTGELTIGPVEVRHGATVEHTSPITVTVTERPDPVPAGEDAGEPIAPTRQSEGVGPRGPATGARPPEPLSDTLYLGPVPRVPPGEPFIMPMVTDAEPVVGQQLVVDYVLFSPAAVFGIDGIELSEPEFAGVWFEDVTDQRTHGGRSPDLGARRVNGELYDARVLRTYALFPLEAGALVVPSIELVMELRSFGRRGNRRIVTSRPMALDVQPHPSEGRPDGFVGGNVGVFNVSARLDRDRARVGDTVNVMVEVNGAGLLSRVVPPGLPTLANARTFEPEDSVVSATGRDLWRRGTVTRRIALTPTQAGELEIPALTFSWYDPWEGAYRSAQTQRMTVDVHGVNPNAPAVVEVAPDEPDDDWVAGLPPLRPLGVVNSMPPLYTTGWYPAAVAAPAVALGVFSLVGWGLRRREDGAGDREVRRAAATAKAGVDTADAGGLAKLLLTYLSTIGGRPLNGLTKAQLSAAAEEIAGDAGVALAALVERCGRARYEGGDVASLRADARAAIDAVEATR